MIFIDNPEEELSLYRQAADKKDFIKKAANRWVCNPYDAAKWFVEHGIDDIDLRGYVGYLRGSKQRAAEAAKTPEAKPAEEKEAKMEAKKEGTITLTTAEAAIIRDYLTKCRNAHEDGNAGQAFTAGDRLATVLDVILTLAAARTDA